MVKQNITLAGVDKSLCVNRINIDYDVSALINNYVINTKEVIADFRAKIYLKNDAKPKYV